MQATPARRPRRCLPKPAPLSALRDRCDDQIHRGRGGEIEKGRAKAGRGRSGKACAGLAEAASGSKGQGGEREEEERSGLRRRRNRRPNRPIEIAPSKRLRKRFA